MTDTLTPQNDTTPLDTQTSTQTQTHTFQHMHRRTNTQTNRHINGANHGETIMRRTRIDDNHSCKMCNETNFNKHSQILNFLDKYLKQDHNFYKEVQHSVCQFVDDSSSSLGFKTIIIMKNYLELYLELMENYYIINKLKLNINKTKYLINCNKNKRKELKDFCIKSNNEIIYPNGNIRILGILFSSDNTFSVYCNDLISQVNYRFINLMKAKSLTNPETRLKFCNAFLIGKLNYAIMLFLNGRKADIHKLHCLYMKIARKNCHF